MGRPIGKLSAIQIEKLSRKIGMHGDGGGLWFCVSSPTARSWLYRFQIDGKARTMGLGPYPDVSLAAAREKASAARILRIAGRDPIATRDEATKAEQVLAARAITFKECAEKYIAAHKAGWKSSKHGAQWTATLEAYAYPMIGKVSASDVDVAMVHKILEPIWSTKTETASRVRGRIESILDWAKSRGFRDGENPARWRGHLENLFPARSKVHRVVHHAALPYAEMPAFMASLAKQEGEAARALAFTILTAARTDQSLKASPREIDRASRLWTVPGERMKGGREHRVPLSPQAFEMLSDAGDYLFPSVRRGKPLSNMSMLELLRRMGRDDITVHGFRSTFKDWASETTNFANEVSEAALAHVVDDKTEAAYRRGEMLEKRRRLMIAWADYCTRPAASGSVVPMRGAR